MSDPTMTDNILQTSGLGIGYRPKTLAPKVAVSYTHLTLPTKA